MHPFFVFNYSLNFPVPFFSFLYLTFSNTTITTTSTTLGFILIILSRCVNVIRQLEPRQASGPSLNMTDSPKDAKTLCNHGKINDSSM